jgi:hypothetical protein
MDNNFQSDQDTQSPNNNIYGDASRGIVTLPPISHKIKKRVSHRPDRITTIQEKSEENDVIEKAIEDNIG